MHLPILGTSASRRTPGRAGWLLPAVLGLASCAGPAAPGPQVLPSATHSTPASPDGQAPVPGGPPGLWTVGAAGASLANVPGGAPSGSLRAGVLVPFDMVEAGWIRVTTPCERVAWVPSAAGAVLRRPAVVLDPGHGGDAEPGAVGPGGLQEGGLNLDVALRTAAALAAAGVAAALTRAGDYTATLAFRAAVAGAARPAAYVSIHHNADPDGPLDRPGTEIYYQLASAESRRLAGLLQEEVMRALSGFPARWVGDTDAGAKWRTGERGDYYAQLRLPAAAGVTAILAELAFVSNPDEEALLRRDDVREAEAGALARAIVRFLRTPDPGSGFTTPYPRTDPAGGGGTRQGCVDPG